MALKSACGNTHHPTKSIAMNPKKKGNAPPLLAEDLFAIILAILMEDLFQPDDPASPPAVRTENAGPGYSIPGAPRLRLPRPPAGATPLLKISREDQSF
ncbi:MAG: hypothetical protein AB1916_11985 [Thermodesulfobacteriota bacterium]